MEEVTMKLGSYAITLAASIVVLFSQGIIAGGTDDIVFTPIGDAYLQVGQIVNGYYQTPGSPMYQIYHMWQQQAYAHVGYDALINKKLDVNISVGGSMVYSNPQIIAAPATLQSDQVFLINSAYASYPLLQDSRLFSLTLQGGYFPYKYNPDVRNLGEYLFRTNAYPMLVYSSFDYPQVRILGARVGMQALDSTITNDVILHSEVLGVPVQDWSVADILNADLFHHVLDIGGGVDLTHLLSVYPGPYNSSFNEVLYDYYYSVNSSNSQNMVVRNITTNANGTKDTVSDTLGWGAIKLMGRFSFDPKNLLKDMGEFNLFGKNDLKLYGEADIIGVKDYPNSTPDLAEFANRNMRTIYSMGLNLPTFKLLDVANIEMEYNADTTSSFSDLNFYTASAGPSLHPLTFADIGSYSLIGKRSPWRWSCYVKKSVCNDHVSFIAQAARDHSKIELNYWNPQYMSRMEALPAGQNWWWSFKTEVKF
jgi:hypothetical protein